MLASRSMHAQAAHPTRAHAGRDTCKLHLRGGQASLLQRWWPRLGAATAVLSGKPSENRSRGVEKHETRNPNRPLPSHKHMQRDAQAHWSESHTLDGKTRPNSRTQLQTHVLTGNSTRKPNDQSLQCKRYTSKALKQDIYKRIALTVGLMLFASDLRHQPSAGRGAAPRS